MKLKMVIIGGGSSYTPELIEGIINRHQSFPVTEIILVDIEKGREKLKIIANLAKRMIKKSKLHICLSWTLNRKEALMNADFITSQIRVGGLEARANDEAIPLSHGLIGQETNGAGGVFKAFRTIPVLLDIAKDAAEICPNAWLINFTNPAGMITEALLKHSLHKRVIGVCNIPYHMTQSVAEILQVDAKDIHIEFIGMNHFIFASKVIVHGRDRLHDVIEKLSDSTIKYSSKNIVSLGWSKELLESLQLIPNPYHQYYFQKNESLENELQQFKQSGSRAIQVQQVEKELFELYKDENLDTKPKELELRGGAYYSEVACDLMDSIYNNRGDIQTVNTLNNGAIKDIEDDAVIEINCKITSDGPIPISIGVLPNSVKGLILSMRAFEQLVIDAGINGDKKIAYQAFINNPLIREEKKSKEVLDKLLEVHRHFLPQF